MKKYCLFLILIISFTTFAQNTTCEVINQCIYRLQLFSIDSSGWNGNTMSIIQNNQIITTVGENFTFGNTISVNFALCDDTPFELVWNEGGQFPEKVKVVLATSNLLNIFIKEFGFGVPNSSLFSAVSHCSTDCCFFYPDNLIVTSVTENSAVLAWSSYFGATQWDVILLTDTDFPNNNDSFTTANTNPFILTDLQPCTEYKFYVRYRCSETSVGNWSSENVVFTTNCVLSDKDFSLETITLYPNPTSNLFHFSTVDGIENIQIYDVFDKLLTDINKGFITNSISIESFEQGVYFVKLNSGKNTKTFRIIKK